MRPNTSTRGGGLDKFCLVIVSKCTTQQKSENHQKAVKEHDAHLKFHHICCEKWMQHLIPFAQYMIMLQIYSLYLIHLCLPGSLHQSHSYHHNNLSHPLFNQLNRNYQCHYLLKPNIILKKSLWMRYTIGQNATILAFKSLLPSV